MDNKILISFAMTLQFNEVSFQTSWEMIIAWIYLVISIGNKYQFNEFI